MPSNFIYDNREQKFIINEWLDGEKIFSLDKFKDYYSLDDVEMILNQSLKLAKEVLAPTGDDGETQPCHLVDGQVIVPKSFARVYRILNENGFGSNYTDEKAEGLVPGLIRSMYTEFFAGANIVLVMAIGLTASSAGLIQSYGDKKIKDIFLPKMFSGEWAGTMCLTETGGGSDVGDMLSKAYPTDNPLLYKIKGTKIFISQGDHDMTDNIVHLVLARVEGAAPGTKGVSLFVVPKYWVNEDGSLGKKNDVTTVALEHKLGWKGSATVMLNFGDDGECRGWLLGNPPNEKGEAQGMAQMFEMINESRMITGLEGLSISQLAYNNALQYAKERVQGRKFTGGKDAPRVRLIEHEDVRRMLMLQKSTLDAMRALLYKTYYDLDVVAYSNDNDDKRAAKIRIEINTPLVKAYLSDRAWELTAEAIQIYGGYGYSEDYPVAKCARDSKILSIWEGTNFIQSLDLVGRKWSMEKGEMFAVWMADIQSFTEKHKDDVKLGREIGILADAYQAYKSMREFIISNLRQNPSLMPLYSTRILHMTAMLYCGMLILDQALLCEKKIGRLSSDTDNPDNFFYRGKVESARYYLHNIVPEVHTLSNIIRDADISALNIPEEAF
jgi:3-(methylthio)propanoyl-CoA dehydrogenase